MLRIVGINLPDNKNIYIALTYIKGIGNSISTKILNDLSISPNKKVADITEKEEKLLREEIAKIETEGDLRRSVAGNIKRLKDIGSYRGFRHIKKLPLRGQKTQTNARTRRTGKKRVVANKKKVTK